MSGRRWPGKAGVQAVVDVLRLPDVRRIEVGWGLSLTGSTIATVALLVYAYDAGGAGLVAVYGVVRTVPAAVLTPPLAGLADRLDPQRLLRWTTGGRAILVGLAAAAAILGLHPAIVLALAGASSSAEGTFRPLQAASLPWLARTPAEVAAANATATLMENAGTLIGPVVAGLVLVLAGPAAAIAVAAAFLGLATVSIRRLMIPATSASGPRSTRSLLHDVKVGVGALGRIAPPAGLAVLAFGQTFVRGALLVLVVVLAVDTMSLGDSAVGWLNAVIGLGGLIGGAAAAAVVRITRLGRTFVTGVALWGLPLVLLAVAPSPSMAYVAFFIVGVGNSLEDAGLFTLLPRLAGHRVAGRALGALELVAFAGIGIGSATAPLLLTYFGLLGVLAVIGGVLAVLAAAYAVQFIRIDRSMLPPGPELELVRELPMFATLHLVAVEQLAAALQRREYDPGDVVMREGDHGDEFHVIADGSAAVTVRGQARPTLHAGDGFGEIALMHDSPRTATVTAADRLHTVALPRAEFLAAVTGNRVSHTFATALAKRRLAADISTEAHRTDAP